MSRPTISTINFSELDDRVVQSAIRAVNRQITEDFTGIWGSDWELTLHASAANPNDLDTLPNEPVRGAGVLYLVNESTLPGALGYHFINAGEVPFGFVFVLDPATNEWTITLSHEALEMMIDPTANVLVPGPDPRNPAGGNIVLHAYEVCDAVERTSYDIDGIAVSNFITPNWFFEGDVQGTRNDFLGVGVKSFLATPGSHLAFFDLNQGWQVYFGQSQDLKAGLARRVERYIRERRRPDESKVLSILAAAKEKPARNILERGKLGMERVSGITRTDRHKAAVEKLFQHLLEAKSSGVYV
jgi:hypothetical protein